VKKNTDNPWQMMGVVGTLGLEIFLGIVGGIFLGRYLDGEFHTQPIWLVIGILGGLLIGLIGALFTLKTFIKE